MNSPTYNKNEATNTLVTRHNNFDLLRLMLAFCVLLVHLATLTASNELQFLKGFLSAKVAVDGFFVISGFLIFRSFESTSSLTAYFRKRLRRIYPAYFSVVTLCVILGFIISTETLAAYFSISTLKYLIYNLSFLNFLQANLPGVFDGNKLNAVNGALWTIKIEVLFYLSVPLIVILMRRFGFLKVLVIIYVLSTLYFYLLQFLAEKHQYAFLSQMARQLPGQLRFFVSGALLYYFLPFFSRHKLLMIVTSIAVTLLSYYSPALSFAYPFTLAVIILYLAIFIPQIINLSRVGDFSFGMYIFHFPIIQTLIYYGWFDRQPLLVACIAIILTTVTAIASWYLIEKPSMKKTLKVKHA